MLSHVLVGSVSSVMRRLKIKLAFKCSFWGMVKSYLLMKLTAQNGYFVLGANRPITSSVLPPVLSSNLKPKDGLLPALSMNASRYLFKRVTT